MKLTQLRQLIKEEIAKTIKPELPQNLSKYEIADAKARANDMFYEWKDEENWEKEVLKDIKSSIDDPKIIKYVMDYVKYKMSTYTRNPSKSKANW